MPLVSIIMPAYNAERLIGTSVQSVLDQSFKDWELIVVDDCSTDATRDVVASLADADPRVRLEASSGCSGHSEQLEHSGSPRAVGPGETRNTGIALARGRFLAFLDCDDRWLPDKLERQIAFMRAHHHAFTFTRYRKVDESGAALGAEIVMPERVAYGDVLKHCCMATPTVVLDREQIKDIKMPNLSLGEDHVLWLSVLKQTPYAYCLQDILTEVVVRRGSLSANKLRKARAQWHVYRRALGLGWLRALWCWLHYVWHGVVKYRRPSHSRRPSSPPRDSGA